MTDYRGVVNSPRLLNTKGGLKQPADLVNHNLLHVSDHNDWHLWLGAVGRHKVDHSPGILFSDATCAISAAIAGQGIAMGDTLLSADCLKRGLLVRPFDISIPSNRGFYLVTDPLKAERPVVKAFSEWIIAEVMATTHSN